MWYRLGMCSFPAEVLVGLEGEPMETEYVAASGSVQATTWAEVTEEQMLTETEKIFGGKEKENHVLLFGDLELDFIKPHMESDFEKEVLEEKNIGLGDWTLPFSLRTEVYRPYETAEKTYTAEEAKALLEAKCKEKLRKGWQKASPWRRRKSDMKHIQTESGQCAK